MKKIILALALSIMLVCLFAIAVSAEVTTFENEPEVTNIQILEDEIIEFNDGFKCPSAYVFKDQTSVPARSSFESCTDFTYLNAELKKLDENAKTYTYADVKGFDLPSGYTFVGIYSGGDAKSPSWVSFPNTITSLDNAIFQNSTTLEKCTLKFTEDNPVKNFPTYMFYGCKKLTAFSMPDCFTTILSPVNFYNCNAMTAVYLSKNLTNWYTQGGGGGATFDNCNNMYFVNEPFTYDNIPEKPTVYYFPKNLTSTTDQYDFSVQSSMRHCYQLNDVMVFGDKVTVMSNAYFFQNIGACKIVFLGDMTNVSTQYWGKTTQIIFANPADKSTSDITYSGGKATAFCNAEGNTTHLRSPKADIKTPATCVAPEISKTFCFCGYDLGEKETAPALGHDYNYEGELAVAGWNYNGNYFANACLVHVCAVCTVEYDGETVENSALFESLGYSASEDDATGITYEVYANVKKIAEFKEYDPTAEIYYGIVVSAAPSANPLTYAGGKVTNGANTVKIDMSTTDYNKITTKITNLPSSIELNCSGYVCVDGVISYLNHNTSDDEAFVVSHAAIIELLNPKTEEAPEEIPAE